MKIVECPRDAMQGIEKFIPTQQKIDYINQLLKVGFDTLDCGSFVSPKAIPQMRDTAEVFSQLDIRNTTTSILAIVANVRGAKDACRLQPVDYIGFPLSLSETFQHLNTNRSIAVAFDNLSEIQHICTATGKILVCYISMGFGNPFGDPYTVDAVVRCVDKLSLLGVKIISLADTVGIATPDPIYNLFVNLTQRFPSLDFGVHLHATPVSSKKKIEAAYKAGCTRFDGTLKGWGGCPMAKNKLVGNVATETILAYLNAQNENLTIDTDALAKAISMTEGVFGNPKV